MRLVSRTALALSLCMIATAALAGAHTWDVWEVFSNASGTIQFVELKDPVGTSETFIGGHQIQGSPSGNLYTIVNNLSSGASTNNKFWLVATPAFAALPGAPAPDEIKPAGFLFATTDTSVAYVGLDTMTFGGLNPLPLDGIHSLQRPGLNLAPVSSVNSPTNFRGDTASVDATPPIPGVPGLTVAKNAADGSSLTVTFNTATCGDANDHQIVYGQRSGLPAALGGTFTPLGGACNMGTTSPFVWNTVPDASDGSGLLWFVVVGERNAGREGLWGTQTGNLERSGPGTNGASNVCGITNKDVAGTCGN